MNEGLRRFYDEEADFLMRCERGRAWLKDAIMGSGARCEVVDAG